MIGLLDFALDGHLRNSTVAALCEIVNPAFVPDLEKSLIADSGHWTQQEQPHAVNRVILDWLDRRFPL